MAINLRNELTNFNVAMSDKDFTETLHCEVMAVNGVNISLRFKKMNNAIIKFAADKWKRAIVTFKSGTNEGATRSIVSHLAYNSDIDQFLTIQLNGAINNISLGYWGDVPRPFPQVGTVRRWIDGDKISITWDVSTFPNSLVSGDIINSNFHQESPATEIFDSACTARLWRCNINNVVIPTGMQVNKIDGINSVNEYHLEQNDGNHWILDKDTLLPTAPVLAKLFTRLGMSIDPADIPALKQDFSTISIRDSFIKGLLEKTNGAIVILGTAVIEDNTATNDWDVKLRAGTILSKRGTLDIESVLSKDSPMTRHFITGGIPDSDTNIEIDPTKYNDGQDLVAVDPNLFYKSIFAIDKDNKIHWVYPIAGYATALAAGKSLDPAIPGIGIHVRSTAVIIKGSDVGFPLLASGKWIDKRPKIENILNTAKHIDEGI